jgi:5-methylcytosine-specific restriction protein B
MARKNIRAVLWRKANQATVDTLRGTSTGQYDIRLVRNSPELEGFFAGPSRVDPTAQGGYTIHVPIAAFDGPNPVPAQSLDVRFMGQDSQRKDWNIPSQRPETAYPLWRKGRGLPANCVSAIDAYACLIRDTEGQFHARWLTPQAVERLPSEIRETMEGNEVGVWLSPTGAGGSTVGQTQEIRIALQRYYNVLIYGPPGTGKTRLVQDVMTSFAADAYQIDTSEEHSPIIKQSSALTAFVTFHQSYSYEEFVVGLRTRPGSEKLIDLQPVPGILLHLSEHARDGQNSSLLVIDEINRGNVSRVFGEFITLLEPDKRLQEDGKPSDATIKIHLPYAREDQPLLIGSGAHTRAIPQPFSMPLRVYTLATMNSVDKSVAPLDSALRRRFHIVHLEPNLDLMADRLGVARLNEGDILVPATGLNADDVKRLGLALIRQLNEGISYFRGPEYRLGHWYLRELEHANSAADATERLCSTWRSQLLPQLEDLFHGRVEQIQVLLGPAACRSGSPTEVREPPGEYADVGAVPWVRSFNTSDERLMRFLRDVARVKAV